MDGFFAPRTIALAGASDNPGKIGNLFIKRLATNFRGRILPVHPEALEIAGFAAYPDIASIPETIDLLIGLVPAEGLLPLVQSCEEGRVKYLLAISSGFGETSGAGKDAERSLVEAAAERGMRVVGPNCMGMLNGGKKLNASLVPHMPPGGSGLSCLTQSGGFGITVSMYALDHQVPIAKICDLGNTADVQVAEVMQYFEQDAETRVVALFLEAVRQPEEFLDALGGLAAKKPVILTALGRTPAGIRASIAHLGLRPDLQDGMGAPGLDNAIPARTGLELLHIAKALCLQPTPRGSRAGIITATGGIGAELADLCAEEGIEVPEFSAGLQMRLARHLPPYAALGNPVDLTPVYWDFPNVYPALIRMLLASEEIDLLIVSITDVAAGLDALMRTLPEAVNKNASAGGRLKPVYVFWGSRHEQVKNMQMLESAGIPCFRSTLETVLAAAAVARYAER